MARGNKTCWLRDKLWRRTQLQHDKLTSRDFIPKEIGKIYPVNEVWRSLFWIASIDMPWQQSPHNAATNRRHCFWAIVIWNKENLIWLWRSIMESERLYDILLRFNVILLELNKRFNFLQSFEKLDSKLFDSSWNIFNIYFWKWKILILYTTLQILYTIRCNFRKLKILNLWTIYFKEKWKITRDNMPNSCGRLVTSRIT